MDKSAKEVGVVTDASQQCLSHIQSSSSIQVWGKSLAIRVGPPPGWSRSAKRVLQPRQELWIYIYTVYIIYVLYGQMDVQSFQPWSLISGFSNPTCKLNYVYIYIQIHKGWSQHAGVHRLRGYSFNRVDVWCQHPHIPLLLYFICNTCITAILPIS